MSNSSTCVRDESKRYSSLDCETQLAQRGRSIITTRSERASAMEQRLLTKEQALAYCGNVSASTFDRYVRLGLLPPKLAGTHALWDKKAIDLCLDRVSGLALEESAPEDRSSRLNAYLEQLGAHKS